ncbi:NAD(P)-binding protein [Stipitochalara longipes BDJ]|nr:NAD(P)-binding protein [Stipitochalara longipes BDJ]
MSQFSFHSTGAEIATVLSERVKGKIIAITGASNGGLGGQTAIDLGRQGPNTLLLLGRSLAKIQPVIDSIKSASPHTIFHFIPIDLASIASVREAAQRIRDLVPHLDILINNVGVMAIPTYQTAPNFHSAELQFAANHLGHFLLTNLVLPLFRSTGDARIVNLSSEGHCFYDGRLIDLNDVNFNGGATYNEWAAYGLSKSANILFARSLAAKLKDRGIRAYSLHPGAVINTNLANTLSADADWSVALAQFDKTHRSPPLPRTLAEGTATTVAAALDPSLDGHSGAYLSDSKPFKSTHFAFDLENADILWKLSEELVGEKFTL